ncbi:heterokaryon incompatibility protein-domain-containing protein [Tricladium varicosporioides]|nr:heterokaryon incompatibility protein-domain-containing protein [Hymenoscyphus varicosporioides]
MFCDQCYILLDLDVSFPADFQVKGQGPRVAHHDSYSTLCKAAHAGCELCQLIVEQSRGGSILPSLVLSGPKWQIFVEITHDGLIINIPIPIGYDELEQEKSIEDFDIGEDNIRLYISTKYNDPLASLFSMRPLSEDSNSEGCFKIASEWLQTCLDTHDKCPKQLSPLPSRVVDVGSDSIDPFLHISQGESSPWLALSHCWGQQQTLTTTSKTLETFSQSIPMSDLPETFKDAILITRRLGYQYIWIDSLCIIQDSLQDWESESKKMAMIYQNAAATICADAADGDHQGIFKATGSTRQKFNLLALPYHSSQRGQNGHIFVSTRQGRHSLQIMPLQTRAWVLQEKALSIRSLHYQSTGLSWHCQTSSSTETRPTLLQSLTIRELHRIPHKSLPPRLDYDVGLQAEGDSATLRWWYTQVSDYVARQLTFKKDRFPAIAGLANEFAKRTGYRYMAGIWAEDFHRGLLWKGAVPEYYVGTGPSWSWIGAEYNQLSGTFCDGTNFMKHCNDFAVELIGFSEPKTTDMFLGGGAATILTLRGWCKEIQDLFPGKRFSCFSPLNVGSSLGLITVKPSPTTNSIVGGHVAIWMDKELNLANGQAILEEKKIIIIRISNFETWEAGSAHTVSIWGLLLQPIGELHNTYQRIGLVRIIKSNAATESEGFNLRTIRIA